MFWLWEVPPVGPHCARVRLQPCPATKQTLPSRFKAAQARGDWDNTKALLAAKDVQELINLQASLAQPIVEKAVAYARSVYEITSQSQEEVSKVFEGQVAEINKGVASALDKAAKSAPAGSDVAVAAVKSAIAAANSAYDSMSKAAKQVAEIAEANVAAATNATVKAVSTTAKTAAKKAA